MRCFIITVLFVMLGMNNAYSMTPVTVNFKGKEYTFQYEFYDKPRVLNFKTPSNDRSTPLGTLKAFFYAKAHLKKYEELPEYHCQVNGEPVPLLPEKYRKKFVQMSNSLLTKKITIYGKVLFEDYHIYLTKFSPGSNRIFESILKKMNGKYFVIYDLLITNEFMAELSAQKYDIEKIKTLYGVKE